jgi:single-strand DNA-binding protein
MATFNRVVLAGNLTRDVELRHIPSGTAVCDIGLAINEKVKDASGNWVESAVFVDITLWGRTAEIANEYLTKGSSVLIEGRLKLDSWEQDGQKRSKLKVIGERMQMLGSKEGPRKTSEQSQETREDYSQASGASSGTDDDSIPF